MSGALTGGCQCGAVRFRIEARTRTRASVCHCRMCQKATGGPFGIYVAVPTSALTWTRGEPARFLSSSAIARGFCSACGTPLTFEAAAGGEGIGLTIGAFDDPSGFAPVRQINYAGRVSWIEALHQVPVRTADEDAQMAARYPAVVSRQHPDHDTEARPSPGD